MTPWLVLLGDGAAEVDGSEGGEDERLQGGDQADLEREDRDAERQRQPAERRDAEQYGQRSAHEEEEDDSYGEMLVRLVILNFIIYLLK